jgi:hypothetical protein
MRSILNVGAVICCLIGVWWLFTSILYFCSLTSMPGFYILLPAFLDIVLICFSFAPAIALLNSELKNWHLVVIAGMEMATVAFGLFSIFIWFVTRFSIA